MMVSIATHDLAKATFASYFIAHDCSRNNPSDRSSSPSLPKFTAQYNTAFNGRVSLNYPRRLVLLTPGTVHTTPIRFLLPCALYWIRQEHSTHLKAVMRILILIVYLVSSW